MLTEDKNGNNRQEADIASKTDSLNFSRKGTINLVTGETTLEDWVSKDGTTFADYENPVKNGYVVVSEESNATISPDLNKSGGHTGILAESDGISDIVVYRPVGVYTISYASGKNHQMLLKRLHI